MTTIAVPAILAPAPALEVARALGDPLRWRIIELLAGEQLCVAHLTEELGVGQPLVSHHLKALRTAGLVSTERYRYWTYYRLHPDALRLLADHLDGLARTAPNGTACRRAVDGQAPSPLPAPPHPEEAGPSRSFRDTAMDPLTRQILARSIESLATEFRGIYSLETIERYVNESVDRLSGPRVVDFIPLFVHRFSREQLRALAQAEGAIIKEVPEVLFVCVHNAGRSQMAAALLERAAQGKVHVRSAGSAPTGEIHRGVRQAMTEIGVDLAQEFPKPLT